jgi:stage V sporulation protein G
MKITDVKVFLVDEDKLRAFVSIILDGCFMINDIKVIRGLDGLFISMPSRRKRNGKFKDIAHPLDHSTRSWLERSVLGEYERCLSASEQGQDCNPEAIDEEAAKSFEPSSNGHRKGARVEAPRGDLVTAAEGDGAVVESESDSLDEIQRRHLSDSFWSVG